MSTQNPQEAFFNWLGQALARAFDAVRGPDSDVHYLTGATDHAALSQLTY